MRMTSHEIAAKTLRELEALNERVTKLESSGSTHAARLEGLVSFVKGLVGGGGGDPAKSLYDYVHDNISKDAAKNGNVITLNKPKHAVTITVNGPKDINVTISGESNNSTTHFESMPEVQKFLKSSVPTLTSHAAMDILPYTSAILRQQSRAGCF